MFSVNMVSAGLHLYLNGVRYSKAHSLNYTIGTAVVKRKGIDSIVGFELSPVEYRVTGKISIYRQHGDGGLQGAGLSAPAHVLPLQKYSSIMVVNALTKQVVFRADDCMITDESWDMVAKQRVTGNFSFEGLTSSNEARYD